MAGGYWRISDRMLKKGKHGYDFIGTTPFISLDMDTNEFDLSEIKVILLDLKETEISLDTVMNNHIITPVFLESEGFSQDIGGLVYTGKTTSSYGTPVDLEVYVYFNGSNPKKIPVTSIEFVGTTIGDADEN